MGIIDNPFDFEKLADDSKSERGKSNAFAIARSVDISADNEEAKEWIVDTYNRGSDLKEYEELGDGVSEVADGAVPIYYDHLWKVFVGVKGWTDNHQDYLEDMGWQFRSGNLDKGAQIILYGIAESILWRYANDHDLRESI